MAAVLSGAKRSLSTYEKVTRWLKLGSLTIFFGILIAQALIVSLQQGNPDYFLREIVSQFVDSTKQLDEQSLALVEQKGVYDGSGGVLKGVWGTLVIYGNFFANLYVIWIWIFICSKLLSWTIFSDHLSQAKNYIFGTVLFLILQGMYLVMFDPSEDKMQLLVSPFFALVHFAQAIPYLISPVAEGVKKIQNPFGSGSVN